MKCYAIKVSGGEDGDWIADVPRPIRESYYGGSNVQLAYDDGSAKHYKNRSAARSWLSKQQKKFTCLVESLAHENNRKAEELKEALEEEKKTQNPTNAWSFQRKSNNIKYSLERNAKNYACAVEIETILNSGEIVELEMEHPNFPSQLKLLWSRYKGYAKGIEKNIVNHTRYECKACGLKLKNIPYFELASGNSTKICVLCMKKQMSEVDRAYATLPDEFIERWETETFLENI